MKSSTTDILWDMLLELRRALRENGSIEKSVTIKIADERFRIVTSDADVLYSGSSIIISKDKPRYEKANTAYYCLNEQLMPVSIYNHLLKKHELDFLNIYLPYCFSFLKAKSLRRCVTILHLAQTLDGKIATKTGNSKWIGNDEDLLHSHRMRALSDGVLIGTNTLKCDKPALTVRHVKGPDPVKIVVGNSICDFTSLVHNKGKVIFFTHGNRGNADDIKSITITGNTDRIEPDKILQELFRMGIYLLYIEGGAITASSFLKGKSVDTLQLFLAPKIFGSGLSNFLLPEISEIKDSVSFSNIYFHPMGEGILFSGKVNY